MTRDDWARLKTLFERALDEPPEKRGAWIAAATAGEPALRQELESLLAAHDTAGTFLEQPPAIDPADLQELPPGTTIGSYEIIDEIGRGGGGVVYRARDRRLQREVALKAVGGAASSPLHDRLRREARAAAAIRHPSVATIHAFEEIDDRAFVVSELVVGETLRRTLARGPLGAERARRIAIAVAEGLEAAHAAGVVHRDLKPENVLLTPAGAVKIVDFGIARVLDDAETRLTRDGALLGTPAYMAPEQLLGGPVDARADLYAFGLVLTEMLTGRHPGALQPDRAASPTPLSVIAQRCTQASPAERFQSATDLLGALRDRPAGRHPSSARWWWAFHHAAAALFYALMIWPGWIARGAIGGRIGRSVFVALLVTAIAAITIRLHLLFTARSYAAELDWARHRMRWWLPAADAGFVLTLASGALLIREEDTSLDLLLLSASVGCLLAFTVIEPATTRAAFRRG